MNDPVRCLVVKGMGLRTRTKVIIGIASGVVVVGAAAAIAGPVIYANTVNGQAAAAPSLSAAPSGGTGKLSASEADGSWKSTATRSPATGCTRRSRARM